MHGIIFVELKAFVEQELGADAWKAALEAAGIEPTTVYLPIREYPDSDIDALVSACADLARLSSEIVLKRFGQYIVPDLVKTYPALIDKKWKTLALIQNTDMILHKVVRARIAGAKPPSLRCEEIDPGRLRVFYRSQRRLCALARGIMLGVAKHYGERITVDEPQCRLRNPNLQYCEFVVTLISR